MSENPLADTKPDLQPFRLSPASPPRLNVEISGRTHVGRVRTNNEDNFHIVQFGRYLRTIQTSLAPQPDAGEGAQPVGHGFAVADGMGGHAAGEVASRMAIAQLIETILQTPDWILGRDEELLTTVMERTSQRFRLVDEAVRAQASDRPGLHQMGTTLSLALSLSDALIVAHVGDSRAYLFRQGQLHRLTRDHTLDQQLANLDVDAAIAGRFRHVLTRCIGGAATDSEPDVARYRLADGDRVLLCTDGLTNMVDDELITRELSRGLSSDETCRALVELALERGGKDNVTVIVATYRRA